MVRVGSSETAKGFTHRQLQPTLCDWRVEDVLPSVRACGEVTGR
jgi:hypothetical protein